MAHYRDVPEQQMKKHNKLVGEVPNFCGLEYLTAKGVPMRNSKFGPVIDLDPHVMEKMATEAIIKFGVILRGIEIHLIRSALELSLEKFARELDLSAATVLKWEKSRLEPLSIANQVMVRLMVAEKLKIDLGSARFSNVKTKEAQEQIVIKAS